MVAWVLLECCMMLTMALAAVVGATLVLLGAGGSIVTVPILLYAAGLDVHQAAGTSLLVIALNCAAGLAAHGGYGAVEWRLGIGFTAAALAGAVLALPIAPHLSARATQRAFAFLLAAVGSGMLVNGIGRLVA